jgi:hypothetical protein
VNAVEKRGQRGLGKNDEPRLRAFGEPRIGLEDARLALGTKLHLLLDVALQQRGRDRRPGRRGPRDVPQRFARAEHQHDRDEKSRPPPQEQPQHPCGRDGQEGNQVHAAERRIALQRPSRRGVADREPGKSGEDPREQPFAQRPRCGNEQACACGVWRRHARLQPARRRGKEGEKAAEHHRREPGERRRHAAELVQADVHPRYARAEEPDAECETEQGAAPRRRVHPEVDEDRKREKGERMQGERREREHGRGAREEGVQEMQTRDQVLGLSTRSV